MNNIKGYTEFINESFDTFFKPDEDVTTITSIDEIPDLLKEFKIFIFGEYAVIPRKENISALITKSTNRSKIGYKIIQNYRYNTPERMIERIIEFFESQANTKKIRDDYNSKKKEELKSAISNIDQYIKIGDIMFNSWGYEQTNIDFYQVVDISEKGTVSIRPIQGEQVEGSTKGYHDGGKIRPIKDQFIGTDVLKKRANIYDKNLYLSSKFGTIRKYTDGDKGIYYSWGY